LENNLVFVLGSGPDGVYWDSNQVIRAGENTNWEFDVAHFILRRINKTVFVNVSLRSTIIESLELLFRKRNGLPIVKPVSISSSGWSIVNHVQESIMIINFRIRVNDHAGKNITEFTVKQTANIDCRLCSFVTKWNKVVLTSKFKT
jgi:hypothetical protein